MSSSSDGQKNPHDLTMHNRLPQEVQIKEHQSFFEVAITQMTADWNVYRPR
jgi:hypothetical protein